MLTPDTATALRSKERATAALVSALTPLEDAAGFAALWSLVRAYGAACASLADATYPERHEPAKEAA